MMRKCWPLRPTPRDTLSVALLLCATALSGPAFAQSAAPTNAAVQTLESQIQELQKEVAALKAAQQAAPPVAVATPAAAAEPALPKIPGMSNFTLGNTGIRLDVGGFIEAAGIYRSRDEVADVGSSFSGLPLGNTSQYHTGEFRGTARQSRLSLLAQGDIDSDTHAQAYYETDFLGAASTANSNESNSYNLRMRHLYANVDWDSLGLHVLGGQTWSLLTLDSNGITPRSEVTPLTIDAQYVPGFTWTRQWQFRVVDDINPWLHAGLSVESPQTTINAGPTAPPAGTVTTYPGGSQFASTNNYSSDVAPDVVVKLAADPGWGHFEVYGIGRFFHDQINSIGANGGTNATEFGGGGGAAAILPVVPKMLDLQLSFLAGNGIGRYGSAQLPDVTLTPTGQFSAISEVMGLAGAVAHPTPKLDVYAYLGGEFDGADSYNANGAAYGYGNSAYNNTGCHVIGGTCQGQTKSVWQATLGDWWKFYKGPWGTLQVGLQYSYSERTLFTGVGGEPHVNDNMIFTSFRYYPF